jgi:hypothetical protein
MRATIDPNRVGCPHARELYGTIFTPVFRPEVVRASNWPSVPQNQLRHADVKTTLKVYSHVIPQTQRDAMKQIGGFQSPRDTGTVLKFARKHLTYKKLAEACGSRTHHSGREGQNQWL